MKDVNNLTLDLTGSPIRHTYLDAPLRELAQDIDLFRSLGQGRDCVAWLVLPTERRPRLTLTWAPADMPPGEAWEPFYRFRSGHSPEQHDMRMRYALAKEPIYLNAIPTPVDYCGATY